MLILRKDLGSPQCLKIKGVLHAGPGASFETSSAATLVALGSSFFSLAIELELDSVADTEVDGESSKGRGEVAAGRAAPASSAGAAPSGRAAPTAAAAGRDASRSPSESAPAAHSAASATSSTGRRPGESPPGDMRPRRDAAASAASSASKPR